MKLGLFHITIGMLRLPNNEGIHEAIQLVESLKETLEDMDSVDLNIKGLDTFGQRVLFAKVEANPEDKFWMFISEIKNRIAETSSNVVVTNKFEFTPHMTLIKVRTWDFNKCQSFKDCSFSGQQTHFEVEELQIPPLRSV